MCLHRSIFDWSRCFLLSSSRPFSLPIVRNLFALCLSWLCFLLSLRILEKKNPSLVLRGDRRGCEVTLFEIFDTVLVEHLFFRVCCTLLVGIICLIDIRNTYFVTRGKFVHGDYTNIFLCAAFSGTAFQNRAIIECSFKFI